MRKAVFLDRDGVINEKIRLPNGEHTAPNKMGDFRLLQGVVQSCKALKEAGYTLVVVTNQPGIGDGTMSDECHKTISTYVINTLGLDNYLYATNKNNVSFSSWYKPGNGMFEYAIESMQIDRRQSWMIGDRWKDIVPAYRSGLKTILVEEPSYMFGWPTELLDIQPDFIAGSLAKAVEIILRSNDEN